MAEICGILLAEVMRCRILGLSATRLSAEGRVCFTGKFLLLISFAVVLFTIV